MRVLLHVPALDTLRHFVDVARILADRGHDVRAAHDEGPLPRSAAPVTELRGLSFVTAPAPRDDDWREAATELRALRDYLRYLEPPFARASKLRGRAFRKALKVVSGSVHRHATIQCPHCRESVSDQHLVDAALAGYPSLATTLAQRLELIESAIPSDRRIEAFLRRQQPDVLVVTPLVWLGSRQAEFVKSARALRIPVGFPVLSWDNLSTKGSLHVKPDQVFVWNEHQKREAIELHGVPASEVVVTGAPRFDRFFRMTPETTRAAFCAAHGFETSQPIVTYVCSSEFVAEHERAFVMRWVDEVRRHPALAGANLLIRPHPHHKDEWRKVDLGHPRVAVSRSKSVTGDQLLYDTLHHSAAVVGLNTSAQLEAAIVGRPVLTLLAPEFAGGQERTLHFHYLLREHGGFVDLARDFDTHRAQLVAAVNGQTDCAAVQAFIDRFLRPHGHEPQASAIMANAVESLALSGEARQVRRSRVRAVAADAG